MKFLLIGINSKYIHINPAVYSLRAYAGFPQDTVVVEHTVNEEPAVILEDIVDQNPDVIAFSCYIWNRRMLSELIPQLAIVLPDADIWLGGPEATYNASEMMDIYPGICGIMIGEGEQTFYELRTGYLNGIRDFRDIAGLCVRCEDQVLYTGERASVNLDTIPFPYDNTRIFDNRIIYYETSRGCPFGCAYCLSSLDTNLRAKSIEKVYAELSLFLSHRVKQVKFVDRTFNCLHNHCEKILEYILAHDNGFTNFHFEVSADLLNEHEIELLSQMRRGCIRLEIGVQSTNSETLKSVHRFSDQKKIFENIMKLQKPGNLNIHLDLIAGLPFENIVSFRKSFNEIIALCPDELQLGFLKILSRTGMWEKRKEYGIEYNPEPPYEVLKTKWLSYSDIRQLKHVENVVDIYYNSHQYDRTVGKMLYESGNDAYSVFSRLAGFYGAKGFNNKKPQREALFDILFEYIAAAEPENMEMYRELLTFDCYARENCKSRPSFCNDSTPYKNEIREMTRRREEHIEPFKYSVWEDPWKIGMLPDGVTFIRFVYDKRDAFTNNAFYEII